MFLILMECYSTHFKAGGVAVDLHVIQDHLGVTSEGLTAVAAQVFLKHRSIERIIIYLNKVVDLGYICLCL